MRDESERKKSNVKYIFYLIFSLFICCYPLWVIDFGSAPKFLRWIIIFVLSFILFNFTYIGTIVTFILWIVTLIQSIKGMITGNTAIITYVLFAIFLIAKIAPFIFPLFENKSTKIDRSIIEQHSSELVSTKKKKNKAIIFLSVTAVILAVSTTIFGILYFRCVNYSYVQNTEIAALQEENEKVEQSRDFWKNECDKLNKDIKYWEEAYWDLYYKYEYDDNINY